MKKNNEIVIMKINEDNENNNDNNDENNWRK